MKARFDMVPSKNAITYTWQQLFMRAGVIAGLSKTSSGLEVFGVPVFYGKPAEIVAAGPAIIVIPGGVHAWSDLLEKKPDTLHWISSRDAGPAGVSLPFENPLPALVWGEGYEDGRVPFAKLDAGGRLVFHVDIIASSLFMLSRLEETRAELCDEHGRFPGNESVACRQGFLHIPVVDQYAILLREWFKILKPDIQVASSGFKINLTHDIDSVYEFSDVRQFARKIGGLLLKQRDLSEVLKQLKELYYQFISPDHGEFYRSIYWLADVSEKHGFISDFYFMAGTYSKYQQGYNPASPLVQRCLRDLHQRGHGIGFHPGYSTFQNPFQLASEKEKIEMALGEPIFGGRQHYLRFHVPTTWRHWEQAGLQFDSTMGFADHEGFRCGTCHPFRPFDLEQDREMQIEEVPLIVMDTSLLYYRKLTPSQGKDRVLALARRCAEVGGIFTLLWHNTSFSGAWQKWGVMYPEILSELLSIQMGEK